MRLNKRAHTSPLYVFRIYFERVYLLEGREANPKRSRDTDTRPRQWRKRRKILSLFFALLGYIYIYYYTRVYRMYFVRAFCCPCRPLRGGEESEREDGSARNPSDGRTIHTGRGRGQFGPVAGLDRSAKRERREESKNDRERGGDSPDDTVQRCVLCALAASAGAGERTKGVTWVAPRWSLSSARIDTSSGGSPPHLPRRCWCAKVLVRIQGVCTRASTCRDGTEQQRRRRGEEEETGARGRGGRGGRGRGRPRVCACTYRAERSVPAPLRTDAGGVNAGGQRRED